MSELWNGILTYLQAHWPDAKDFFNSVFFTAIAGSFAGALAGAVTAQRIANKTRNKDELLKEIRAANAATMVASEYATQFSWRKNSTLSRLGRTSINIGWQQERP